MSGILADIPLWVLALAVIITFFAGFVKGAVGFAMPMIMISGLASFLPAETALAALILPTVMANGIQALRQGWRAAWDGVKTFRVYLLTLLVFLLFSAQLVRVLPQGALFLLIGIPVSGFALMQLFGLHFSVSAKHRVRAEVLIGSFAGFFGGMSGVWGPPTVAYLTAIKAPKAEQMRVQGVVYGLGAVVLMGAHMRSGVLSTFTAPLSALMLVPAFLGMVIGLRLHDRMAQDRFRRMTLLVLVVAGLNLMRRGLMG